MAQGLRVVCTFGHQHIWLTLGGLSASFVADIVGERPITLYLDAFAAQSF